MPLRDFARSIRDAFHQEQDGRDARPSSIPDTAASSSATQKPKNVSGDMPSNLFIPDSDLSKLSSKIWRTGDKLRGTVRAQGSGVLGAPGGYTVVEVGLYVKVQLVQTSKKGNYLGGPVIAIGGMQFPQSQSYESFKYEERTIEIATKRLYDYGAEGERVGKEFDLPFELGLPEEAEGFQLAPRMDGMIHYYLCVSAAQYDTGDWFRLFVERLEVLPRDDAVDDIFSTIYPPFLIQAPYQELALSDQPGWTLASQQSWELPCPRKIMAPGVEETGQFSASLFLPTADLLVQKSYPVVLKMTLAAPASHLEADIDWQAFRPLLPTEDPQDTDHFLVQSSMRMQLPELRGGDGKSHTKLIYYRTGRFRWDNDFLDASRPPPSQKYSSGLQCFELDGSYGWSKPTRDAWGRLVTQAFIKGTISVAATTAPTFKSREGDFEIYTTIMLTFLPQGKFMALALEKKTRNIGKPGEGGAPLVSSDGEQLPAYSQ